MANAIVQEVLEFVRPVRLQVERTVARATRCRARCTMADSKAHARRRSRSTSTLPRRRCRRFGGDQHQLTQVFRNLLINAYEALDGRGRDRRSRRESRTGDDGARCPTARSRRRRVVVEVADDGPGMPPEVRGQDLQSVFHDQAAGLRPRPGDRPQDRRRARRPHRPDDSAPGAARDSGSRCRSSRQQTQAAEDERTRHGSHSGCGRSRCAAARAGAGADRGRARGRRGRQRQRRASSGCTKATSTSS